MPLKIQPEARVNGALLMVRAGRKGRALIAARDIKRGEQVVSSAFIELEPDDVDAIGGRLGDYAWEDGFAAGAGSFFNHSEEPNVSYKRKDGVISFKTKRRILAGEELTINYGYEIHKPLAPIKISAKRLSALLGAALPTIH